jgi:hypothetical protein
MTEGIDSDARRPTRRGLIGAGLKLAVAAPVAAAAWQATTALAENDDNQNDDQNQGNNGENRGRGRPSFVFPPGRAGSSVNFNADLCRASDANATNDVGLGNVGSDSLSSGRIVLLSNGNAQLALRGARANVSYDVQFAPFNTGKGREGLGTVGPTNGSGNLDATTPNALGGNNRIGIFIIVRHDGDEAGKDEFVSCAHHA